MINNIVCIELENWLALWRYKIIVEVAYQRILTIWKHLDS